MQTPFTPEILTVERAKPVFFRVSCSHTWLPSKKGGAQ